MDVIYRCLDCGDHLRMTVSDVHDRNAAGEIDVFSAFNIFYYHPFGGFDI
jgi:hypothetical protein